MKLVIGNRNHSSWSRRARWSSVDVVAAVSWRIKITVPAEPLRARVTIMPSRIPALLAAAAFLASGACTPRAALEVRPSALADLAQVESVFVDSALLRRGGDDGGDDGGVAEESVRERIDRRLLAGRRPRLAERRDVADVLLVFEQSDRLRCRACEQPLDRWHWWGFVFDRDGREIASWHDEVYQGRREPANLFVRELRRLLARARRAAR